MYFNHRIIQESKNRNVPVAERLKFLGIYANNIDEFFRVRIPALKKEGNKTVDTINEIYSMYDLFNSEYYDSLDEIKKSLKRENIVFVNETELSGDEKTEILDIFLEKIIENIETIQLEKIEGIKNKPDGISYMTVILHGKNEMKTVMKISNSVFDRFYEFRKTKRRTFIFIDDIIRLCVPYIFSSYDFDSFESYSFSFIKSAEMNFGDLSWDEPFVKIKAGLESRNSGEYIVMFKDSKMPDCISDEIKERLSINCHVIEYGRYMNCSDFMEVPIYDEGLSFEKRTPIMKDEFKEGSNILKTMQERDLYLHVPYHSFDNYLNFLKEASVNEKVNAITMTIYRISEKSEVADILMNASMNGKKVTVYVELLARFDEYNNMICSERMKEAGIDVRFGHEGLKIHAKMTLVEMDGGDVVCINTGNFHDDNAKVYTDFMLFTSFEPIIEDTKKTFSVMDNPKNKPDFRELLVSPINMKENIIRMIRNEKKNRISGKPAYIKIKINNITDREIINELYDAASSGVKIDILLRGLSSIRNIYGNMEIHGIVDRYLEHSRIFIFCNSGYPLYYIGSSDWMKRNMDDRIELLCPVYSYEIKKELELIIEYGMRDNVHGRIVDGTGKNRIYGENLNKFESQSMIYKHYLKN